MPVTPFHFGPGLLLRALLPRVSLSAFVAANVPIDPESLYFLARGEWPVHRTLHTFLLGSAAGLAAGVSARPVSPTEAAGRSVVDPHPCLATGDRP